MRTLSCRISDSPKVATIESAGTLWIGWMMARWIKAPRMKPSQKFPVDCSVAHASTVPTMKKSPCARLMMSSRPKMIASPSAISAMIKPQIRPLVASRNSLSIAAVLSGGGGLECDHVAVDAQLLVGEPECEPDQLRQVQHRHVE